MRLRPSVLLAAQRVEQLLPACVAAAQDQRDALARPAARAGGGRPPGAPRLRPRPGCASPRSSCACAARISSSLTSTKSSSRSPEDPLRQLERRARGESLGERLHPVLDELDAPARSGSGRRRLRLDADHPDGGVDRLGDDAGAGRAAAAADRDDDHLDARAAPRGSRASRSPTPAISSGSLPECT